MEQLRRILVAVKVELDESGTMAVDPLSRPAVRQAIATAAFTGCQLEFLTVIDESTAPPASAGEVFAGMPERVKADTQAVLEDVAEQARQGGTTATTRVVAGLPFHEIICAAVHGEADLVVAGSQHSRGPIRSLLGSTIQKLLRKCPCAVWIVQPSSPDADEIQTVVVADGLNDTGISALHCGVQMAQVLSARLLVVHSIEYQFERWMAYTGMADGELMAYRDQLREQAVKELHDRLSATDYRTIEAGTNVHIANGPADIAIEQAVQEHNAELLVMGTRGRGGLTGMLLGNTAERLLPRLGCSLLAIKPDDFVCPIDLSKTA